MDRRTAQRGEGRVGLLVALAVLGFAIFVGVKIIPVRIAAYEFKDHIRMECRQAALRKDDSTVAKRILDKAEELDIPIGKKQIQIKRTRSEIVVTASYEQAVDLKVYTYTYRFRTTERAPLF